MPLIRNQQGEQEPEEAADSEERRLVMQVQVHFLTLCLAGGAVQHGDLQISRSPGCLRFSLTPPRSFIHSFTHPSTHPRVYQVPRLRGGRYAPPVTALFRAVPSGQGR